MNKSLKKFNIGIKALIVKNGKALVLKEVDKIDKEQILYDLPGGRMEERESIEQTLKRELDEELGLKDFKIKKLIYAAAHPHFDDMGLGLMLLYYAVEAKLSKIKLSKEHIEFQWISKANLEKVGKQKVRMHSGIRTALAKVLK